MEFYELFKQSPKGVIGIDGELGSGKTQLSNKLSHKYGIPVIHVDDFLDRGKNKYLNAIKTDELKSAVTDRRPIIVEGICLLWVLERISISPDVHIFLYRSEAGAYKKGNAIVKEVENYVKKTIANKRAEKVLHMKNKSTNQLDVDIAYIKSKTMISILLSAGGIISLLAGAYILISGVHNADSAVFEILGAKLTAKGIGAVIMGSSVLWAYFAYLSRPKYSRQKEKKKSTSPDGIVEEYEFESATMRGAMTKK